MSRGPGSIERRIADLFAATRDRALSVEELATVAFDLDDATPTRAQRLSTIRAAHRVIRRCREMHALEHALFAEARRQVSAEISEDHPDYWSRVRNHPQSAQAKKLSNAIDHIGCEVRSRMEGGRIFWVGTDYWQATTIGKGRGAKLWFHYPTVPVQVWAVRLDPRGVHWFDAEVTKITERNVVVRYAGSVARLDRNHLWQAWAWWRGVMFVSSRTGYIAERLDALWHERYGTTGSVPPVMQMPLADAIALLGVPQNYTREDVISAFRRAVKKAHPDLGGTAEMFRKLVEARDRLLAALGTSEPAPKMPEYYASGTKIVYRSGRGSQRRIGQTRRLAFG
jgi:hypothetical protein